MLEKIVQIVARYEALEQQMASPEVVVDYPRLSKLAQEHSEIEPLVMAYRQHAGIQQELEDTRALLTSEEDADMLAMAEEEISQLKSELTKLETTMRTLLIPKDPRDARNVFIEIRAGTGGDEAALFAADLLRMYMRFAESRNWKTEIIDENQIGVGGYKEVILAVRGKGAFSQLKFESGVHRVQRVPITESQGRIHTSAATVAVMPEVDDVEITIDERDLEITATFSSGPGGQHMQKNATAARVVHKPSGISVKVQSERSLTQNKRVAIGIIQVRLQEMEEAKHNAAIAADRKSQVGSGDRSEKIRTYNYPQSRVTDHRVGHSSYNLPAIMDGNLEDFIDKLIIADETRKLSALQES